MGGRGRGKKSKPAPEPAQPDWAGIFAAERAAQQQIMNQQRAEAEAQRQREEQQRREEEARRMQEEHNVRQKAADETAMADYTSMKQAAAAQAAGGIGQVTPTSSRATAPGLAPTTAMATQRPVSGSTFAPAQAGGVTPMAGNLPAAPSGVGLGGGGFDFLRQYFSR
jgi:hypothetical protein